MQAFELYDRPRDGSITGIALALLGAGFVYLVWWQFPDGTAQQISALLVAVLGIACFAVGGAVFWFSQRAPYLVLRADSSGLKLVERFRLHREPTYVVLPWAQVEAFQLKGMGEYGYGLEVKTTLPPNEEKRLRSMQKLPSISGALLFPVPVSSLPDPLEEIMDRIRAIGARALESTSNP